MSIIFSAKDPFGQKAWNEFLNQVAFLAEHGISIEEAKKIILEATQIIDEVRIEWDKKYNMLTCLQKPLCPNCNRELSLRLINIPQGKNNLYDYKSSWLCEDPECLYEEFSKNTLVTWLNTLPKKEVIENGNVE